MLKHSEVMDAIKEDLATLGIGSDKLDCFTAEDARIGYLKTAREVHPDKADPNNPEQVAEFTAAFQEVGNAFQRLLQYIIDTELNSQSDIDNYEAIFAK